MNIINMAFRVTETVAVYTERVRRFFYDVMLLAHACPKCDGKLAMVAEGRCQCRGCGHTLDPTIAFQRCSDCGGRPQLDIRRYRCMRCGANMSSRFLFDGFVFNAEYFREKMAESRARKQEQRTRLQARLIEDRSAPLESGPVDLTEMSGLVDALNRLVAGAPIDPEMYVCEGFDLSRYESHVQAHLELFPVSFDDIPPLSEDARLDRIWRFIAIVFMAHVGLIEIQQEGQTIMVMHRETD
jgi:hypothetical protein